MYMDRIILVPAEDGQSESVCPMPRSFAVFS